MGRLYKAARDLKNSIPVLRHSYAWLRSIVRRHPGKYSTSYSGRLAAEADIFRDVAEVHDLPPIFHYWSNKHLRPMLEEYGFSNPDQFFAKYLRESAARAGAQAPVFLSLGAGNCDTEVRVARLLLDDGLQDFTIECLDLNPEMLDRGREFARSMEVTAHISTVTGDFNQWSAVRRYDGVMANQSLHHVVNLEGVFDEIARCLAPHAYFMTDDVIGRNGHQRWPEALTEVQKFWRELPRAYRQNRQLDRYERSYKNWDCSIEGFEGIRAQDVLRLLIERFHFHLFIGWANVIDVFVDRSFGPNFDAEAPWDREFIDRVHAFDEESFRKGALTPTHMLAVLGNEQCGQPLCSRRLTPEKSVRRT